MKYLAPILIAASMLWTASATTGTIDTGVHARDCGSWTKEIDSSRKLAAGSCCYCNYKTVPCHCGHVSGYKTCPCDNECTTGYRPENEGLLDGLDITLNGQMVDQLSRDRAPIADMAVTLHFNGKEIAKTRTDKAGRFTLMAGSGRKERGSLRTIDVGKILALREPNSTYAISLWRDGPKQLAPYQTSSIAR